MGGVETKLKLIACQRNDDSWSIVNNEFLPVEEANDFGDGALIVVNLGVNRQIQGKIELASQKIVGILKNFSRLLEKTKDQEQEIGQWKESLAIQSEELSRRQLEMETRLEQVEQMEEEFEQFEQQRAQIEAARAETEKLKQEFEAKSAELEGAWAQLQGQQQNLAEQLQQSKVLDPTQATEIKNKLTSLRSFTNVGNSLKSQLDLAAGAIKNQETIWESYSGNLEQYSQSLLTKRQELEANGTELANKKQQIESLIIAIKETEQQLGIEQKSLEVKQELTQFLDLECNSQNQILQMLSGTESDANGNQKIDINQLENMPLPNLEAIVENLKKDLEKVARFVNDQEEELGWQCKAVEELEAKIEQVGEFERLSLEQELADEREAKKMLDQTLVGQRRSLKERHQVLLEHSRVLKRRHGIVDFDFESEIKDIDLEPIKKGLAQQHEKLQQRQQELAAEVAQIEQSIQVLETKLQQQLNQKNDLELAIAKQQEDWQVLNTDVIQLQSQIDFYDQQLKPLEAAKNSLSNEISQMEQLLANYFADDPAKAVEEIEGIINQLTVS